MAVLWLIPFPLMVLDVDCVHESGGIACLCQLCGLLTQLQTRGVQASRAYFLELLRVRYSTPLLRLPQAEHINRQLTFHNTGPEQVSAAFTQRCVQGTAVRAAC